MIYAVNKRTKEHRIYQQPMELAFWADCKLIVADADGWIKWNGGECPLPVETMINVKTTCDYFIPEDEMIAGSCYWDPHTTITHYRPIINQEQHMTTTPHENQFGPEPESEVDSTILPRPFRTGPIKEAFSQPNEWRGPEDGLPPVGEKIEYTALEPDGNGKEAIIPGNWYVGKIIAYHDGFVWTSDNGLRLLSNTVFRVSRTDRERWVEKAIPIIGKSVPRGAKNAAEAIYDALQCGNLSIPE